MIQSNAGDGEKKHNGKADHAQVEMEEARPSGDDAPRMYPQMMNVTDWLSVCGSQA
jgi:hypothetical protein